MNNCSEWMLVINIYRHKGMMNLGSVTATLLYRRFAVNSEISCNSSTCRSLTYNARRTGTETYHRLFRRYTRRGAQCVPWWWIGELLWWGLSGNNLTTVDYTLNGSFGDSENNRRITVPSKDYYFRPYPKYLYSF